jgi:hypothetical protein
MGGDGGDPTRGAIAHHDHVYFFIPVHCGAVGAKMMLLRVNKFQTARLSDLEL